MNSRRNGGKVKIQIGKILSIMEKESEIINMLESEFQREASLISQAGFMTAAFSFSTTALFSVWQIGLDYVDTVPKGIIHICVATITLFLLFCILFSVKALAQGKSARKSLEEEGDYKTGLTHKLKESNNKRYKNIYRAIISWYTALAFVFLAIAFLALYYYILPGKINHWFN